MAAEPRRIHGRTFNMTLREAEAEVHAMTWQDPAVIAFGMDPTGRTLIVYTSGPPATVPASHGGWPVVVLPIASMCHQRDCGEMPR